MNVMDVKKPLRFLITDDHTIIRRGLRNLLQSRFPTSIVTDTHSLDGTERIMMTQPLDLLILDLMLSDGNALDRLKELLDIPNAPPILIYSMAPEHIMGRRLINLGCSGFLSKNEEESTVLRAVECVLAGDTYLSLELKSIMSAGKENGSRTSDPFRNLSRREILVMQELANGTGIKEIAAKLDLSPSTVATYKSRLFEKLSIHSVIELGRLMDAHDFMVG